MTPKDSATYCKLSHVSLAVQNEGDVCVCNKNTQSLEDGKRNKLLLHQHGLDKIWHSPTLRIIRANLDHGRRIDSCRSCWNDEAAGIESIRQRYNRELADVEPLDSQPRILIIKPTNVCNMGCRTCLPVTSTGLYQDFYQLAINTNTFAGTESEYTRQFENIRLGLGKNNRSLWDTVESWLPGLHFMDVYGGEPMLAPAMWDRIMTADVDQVALQFHTNGTIWNQHYIDQLPRFKSVAVGVSLDAVMPAHLNYIRHGINTDAVFENIKQYQALSQQYPTISIKISFTLSIYNVFYVDDILSQLGNMGLPVAFNLVERPEHYDLRHLPIPVKQYLIDKFKNKKLSKITKLLQHVIPGCDVEWPRFWQEVCALDQIRQQSFADVFPEYYAVIKPYLPCIDNANSSNNS